MLCLRTAHLRSRISSLRLCNPEQEENQRTIDMAEEAPAPAAAPAKAPKKKSTKPVKAGPSVRDLIIKTVAASKEKKGVSLAAVKKALAAEGYDVEKNNNRVKAAVKALVTNGTLVQPKGTGASGSFKLSKNQGEPKAKKPAKKVAPKTKKVAAKKPAAAKKPKPAAKKAVAAKKSPKKAKKPAAKKAAAKSPKKPSKSPKKAVKKAAAPKKSPAKKVAKPKAAKKTAAKKK